MYWAFNDAADDKKKILVTSQFMDEGPAAAWAGAWCAKELSRSQNDPSRFVWRNFVAALRDTYAPVNVTGDAQARLRQLKQGTTLTNQFLITWFQIMSEAGYGTVLKPDTLEADHLIDLLKTSANQTIVYATVDTYKLHRSRDFNTFCRALKEVGKTLEERNGGKVPAVPTTYPRSTAPTSTAVRYVPIPSLPPRAESSTTASTAPTDRRDSTGVMYGGQGQPMDVGRARGNQSRACYNCGEVGHLSAGCPKPRAPRAQRIRRMVAELSEEEKQEVGKDFKDVGRMRALSDG